MAEDKLAFDPVVTGLVEVEKTTGYLLLLFFSPHF